MIWFLRFFHAYRNLEMRVRELASEKVRMDDRCRWLESRLDSAEEKRTDAVKDAIQSMKMNADFVAQTTIGRTIYGVGPELPGPEDQPEIVKSHSAQARDIVNYANSPEGMREIIADMEKDIGVEE